jgi:hypothetical protein
MRLLHRPASAGTVHASKRVLAPNYALRRTEVVVQFLLGHLRDITFDWFGWHRDAKISWAGGECKAQRSRKLRQTLGLSTINGCTGTSF